MSTNYNAADYRHTAFNLATGEIIQSVTGNALKRALRCYEECEHRWLRSHGLSDKAKQPWVIGHHGASKLCDYLLAHGACLP